MGCITYITGGARSGKSTYAEQLAISTNKKITYIATSIAFDEGMKDRIRKHKEQRPEEWDTIEQYKDFDKVADLKAFQESDILLVDCITVMINNIMFEDNLDFENCSVDEVNALEKLILDEVRKLLDLSEYKDMIVVSNEVGLGLVPAYKMGSYYRDIAGRINQYIASKAEQAYFVVSGIPMKLK